jgi:alpha-glucoside transport system substrate-binding protein
MDRAATEAAFAPGSLAPAVINNELYAVMMKLSSKSVVWYKPNSFKEQGFQTPATYEDMVKITDAYRAKGKKPWAVGAKDSWTLTDWFENIDLLQAGADKYDQLFSGKIAFTDPSVTQAIDTMRQIVKDENLPGGINGALGVGFVDGIGQVFSSNLKAEMYFEGGFVGGTPPARSTRSSRSAPTSTSSTSQPSAAPRARSSSEATWRPPSTPNRRPPSS